MTDWVPVEGKPGVFRATRSTSIFSMTKANEDTLDPVTNDDSLADTPKEDVDPVPDRVGCKKAPARRKMKPRAQKVKANG